jgi:hypothetical protein
MRLFHTADWHLGQTLRGVSREYEHCCFLDWLLYTLRERQVDMLVPLTHRLPPKRCFIALSPRPPTFIDPSRRKSRRGITPSVRWVLRSATLTGHFRHCVGQSLGVLQSLGRKVEAISHVPATVEWIGTQILYKNQHRWLLQ